METDELLSSAGETFEYGRLYVEQRTDYIKLEASKRVAKSTSKLVTVGIIAFLSFMVILFLSISLGLLLGSFFGSYGLSFLFVTILYAVAAIAIYFFKEPLITTPVISMIIKELTD